MLQSELTERELAGQVKVLTPESPEAVVEGAKTTPEKLDEEAFYPVLKKLRAVLGTVDAAPTHEPKSLAEQIVFYENAGDERVYFYLDGSWNYITLGAASGNSMKVIAATRNNTTAAGTVSYAHGLGVAPTKVKVYAVCYEGGALSFSNGTWDGTDQHAVYGSIGAAAVGNAGFVYIDQGASVVSYALVDAVDDTNIDLAWDKVGAPGGTTYLIIEAWE